MTGLKYFLHAYVQGKLFEWIMTLNTLLLGTTVLIWPAALGSSAFKYMIFISDVKAFGLIVLALGVICLTALVVNGRSYVKGPFVRAICASLRAVIWFQMLAALVVFSMTTGFPSPGIPNWFSLIVGELIASYQAGRDVRRSA